jgi:hypothetical protein
MIFCFLKSIQQVMETRSSIFTSGMDGHLRLFEECNGKLLIHNSADNIFSEGIGITTMRVCAAEHVLVAASARKSWGMWSSITLKKILIVNEEEAVRMRMRMRGFLVSCMHCLINQSMCSFAGDCHRSHSQFHV